MMHGLWGPGRELAYIHSRRTRVPAAAIRDVERRLAGLGLEVGTLVSADGRSAVVSAELGRDVPVERIRTAVAATARAHPWAGVGLAAAVLVDATIIRGVLLPATMKLLGEWNWYLPRRLAWLPRVRGEPSSG